MAIATVTSKGRVTIPKEIRRILQVEAGDRIDFIIEADGRVVHRRAGRSILDLRGILARPGRKTATVRLMDRAIGRHHARENERIKRGRS
jgi:antitoxin PrlF